MFEDWARALSDLEIDTCDRVTLRRLLAGSSRMRAALDHFDAFAAAALGEAAAVRSATRCTQREADRAVERGEFLAAAPDIGAALGDGAISGAHVDVLSRAASRTSDMGVLHVEWDDVTFAQVRAVVDAETDRLWRLDGGRDGATDTRTPEQRRADAIAGLLLQRGSSCGEPVSVRHQMVVVAHTDGTGAIPGVGPLPRAEIERLARGADLFGMVLGGDGQVLWHGSRRRLADDNQVRALIARDGGCVGCGAHPSRCEAHHIRFRRHGGPTDIDNLVLVCKHHHHLIHDKGWRVEADPSGAWSLAPP